MSFLWWVTNWHIAPCYIQCKIFNNKKLFLWDFCLHFVTERSLSLALVQRIQKMCFKNFCSHSSNAFCKHSKTTSNTNFECKSITTWFDSRYLKYAVHHRQTIGTYTIFYILDYSRFVSCLSNCVFCKSTSDACQLPLRTTEFRGK